jgi:hypothetical protein
MKKLHKDINMDYNNLNKATGMLPSDVSFWLESDFSLIDNALLVSGVLVGYHTISENKNFISFWNLKTCSNKPEDLAYISKLILNHGKDGNSEYEYFIMDATGYVLNSNCLVSRSVSDQGVIHATTEDGDLDQYIYPASIKQCKYKNYYCHASSVDKLNSQIQTYIDKDYIVKPSGFKKGFSEDQRQER